MAIGQTIGQALGAFLGSGGGNFTNPAQAASPYYDQIPAIGEQYYNPYIQAGQQAMPQLMDQYGRMMDPTQTGDVQAELGAGYQASPGYQYNVQQATDAANAAAAAGGMAGTPAAQQALAQQISGMASQDFGDYMNRQLALQNQGLSGMSGINQMGYGASTGLADMLSRNLMNQGNLAYAGQAAQNQADAAKGGFWGDIGGAIGGLLPF